MKSDRLTITKDLNYFRLALILWREKFLILIFSLVGLGFSFFYAQDIKTFNKAIITINSPPNNFFLTYTDPSPVPHTRVPTLLLKFSSLSELEDRLYIKLLSRDNLKSFLGDEKKLNMFKIKEYKEVPSQSKSNKFEATYVSNIDGQKLLKDYILYTQLNFIKKEVKHLISLIDIAIKQFKKEYEIAEKLGIELPKQTLTSQPDFKNNQLNEFFVFTGPTYLRGTVILKMRIANLEEELARIKKKDFVYNIILDNPYVTEVTNNYRGAIYVAGIILGFLASLMLILIKSLIKEAKRYSKI